MTRANVEVESLIWSEACDRADNLIDQEFWSEAREVLEAVDRSHPGANCVLDRLAEVSAPKTLLEGTNASLPASNIAGAGNGLHTIKLDVHSALKVDSAMQELLFQRIDGREDFRVETVMTSFFDVLRDIVRVEAIGSITADFL
jgi:hypothetical protein